MKSDLVQIFILFFHGIKIFAVKTGDTIVFGFAAVAQTIIIAVEVILGMNGAFRTQTASVFINAVAFFKRTEHLLKMLHLIQIFHHLKQIDRNVLNLAAQGIRRAAQTFTTLQVFLGSIN